jgi:hypothetical protein
MAHRVEFRIPVHVPAERTNAGVGVAQRPPAAQPDPFARFPFAAAVAAGIPYVRDIAGPADRACLVQIEDDELVAAIDRDRAMRECDTEVVDDPSVRTGDEQHQA